MATTFSCWIQPKCKGFAAHFECEIESSSGCWRLKPLDCLARFLPRASFPALLWKSHFQWHCLGVCLCSHKRLLAHLFMRVIANRPARLTSWIAWLMLQLKCPPFIRPDVCRWGEKMFLTCSAPSMGPSSLVWPSAFT